MNGSARLNAEAAEGARPRTRSRRRERPSHLEEPAPHRRKSVCVIESMAACGARTGSPSLRLRAASSRGRGWARERKRTIAVVDDDRAWSCWRTCSNWPAMRFGTFSFGQGPGGRRAARTSTASSPTIGNARAWTVSRCMMLLKKARPNIAGVPDHRPSRDRRSAPGEPKDIRGFFRKPFDGPALLAAVGDALRA